MHKNHEILLGVNVDHIATIRQARGTRYPDPVQAALIAETAGADGITIHLREDRRHIQERDVLIMKEVLQTRMNLEMAATQAMLEFAIKIKPAHCCLVPERREELTTEGGLNILSQENYIHDVCKQLQEANIQVSLFIDPDNNQLDAAKRCGAEAVELHTGSYAEAQDTQAIEAELQRIIKATQHGLELGLIVNAGHGLHYHNTQAIAAIPGITELNIGHGIVARAMLTGMYEAVATMKQLMIQARNQTMFNQIITD